MNINDHRADLADVLADLLSRDDNTKYYDVPSAVNPAARTYADALLASPALARLLAAARDEARAEAWDEGALKRAQTDPACTVRNLNPYRGGTR